MPAEGAQRQAAATGRGQPVAAASPAAERKGSRRSPAGYHWDSGRVRALRQHLGATQQQLSEELGVRQQTVSEWERGAYRPRGASARLLTIVAERAGFAYQAGREAGQSEGDPTENPGA